MFPWLNFLFSFPFSRAAAREHSQGPVIPKKSIHPSATIPLKLAYEQFFLSDCRDVRALIAKHLYLYHISSLPLLTVPTHAVNGQCNGHWSIGYVTHFTNS